MDNRLSRKCPICGSAPGKPCYGNGDLPISMTHNDRYMLKVAGPCSAHHIAFADCPACQTAADLRVCQFCGSRAAVTAMTYHRVGCERDTLRTELATAQARIAVLERIRDAAVSAAKWSGCCGCYLHHTLQCQDLRALRAVLDEEEMR